MMKTRIALVLVLLVGCGDLNTGVGAVSTQYVRWMSHGLHTYTVDQERQCYCPKRGPVRIVVESDQLTSVILLTDSSEIPYPERERYLTIDSLFAIALNPGTDSVVVTYDSAYGYPTTLDINPQLHPSDGGVLYRTSNLRATGK